MYLWFFLLKSLNQKWEAIPTFPGVFTMASATAGGYVPDLKKRSMFTYMNVILFNYDVQCKVPFKSYPRNYFSAEHINPSWFTGPLTPSNRLKILSLPPLGGGKFSVFCEVEIGTCSKRRESIEAQLNETFQEFMDQDFRIDEAYKLMVSAKPSKILSSWSYEAKPKPL